MFGTGSCSILCSQLLHYTGTVLHVLAFKTPTVTGCQELAGFNWNALCNTVSVDTKKRANISLTLLATLNSWCSGNMNSISFLGGMRKRLQGTHYRYLPLNSLCSVFSSCARKHRTWNCKLIPAMQPVAQIKLLPPTLSAS